MSFRVSIFGSDIHQNLKRTEQKNIQKEQGNFFKFQTNLNDNGSVSQQNFVSAPIATKLYSESRIQKTVEKNPESKSIFSSSSFPKISLMQNACNVSDIAKSLILAIQSKDSYTGEHSKAVQKYAETFARKLNLSSFDTECLSLGAAFHDIGKIGVSESILNKNDKLSDEEYEQIKRHTEIGSKILDNMPVLKENIGKIVRHHHESWDGTGYPDKLKGEQIPVQARMIAIIDSYHAMTSNRPYRQGMPKEKASEILQDGAGKQWDPELVDKFLEIIPAL